MRKEKPIKTMNIRLPYETWRLLRICAVDKDMKLNSLIISLIESLRKKNEKKG